MKVAESVERRIARDHSEVVGRYRHVVNDLAYLSEGKGAARLRRQT